MKSLLSKRSQHKKEKDTWMWRNGVTMTAVCIIYNWRTWWVSADLMLPGKKWAFVGVRWGHVTRHYMIKGPEVISRVPFPPCWVGAIDIIKSPWIRSRNLASPKCKETLRSVMERGLGSTGYSSTWEFWYPPVAHFHTGTPLLLPL